MSKRKGRDMNKRIKALWIDALRSGEYEQGTDFLRRKDDTYCCLGVLCDLAIENGVDVEWAGVWTGVAYVVSDNTSGLQAKASLPSAVANWAGLTAWGDDALDPTDTLDLPGLNDGGRSFLEIADVIEQNL
jgi:hypothetical protein